MFDLFLLRNEHTAMSSCSKHKSRKREKRGRINEVLFFRKSY